MYSLYVCLDSKNDGMFGTRVTSVSVWQRA